MNHTYLTSKLNGRLFLAYQTTISTHLEWTPPFTPSGPSQCKSERLLGF